MPRDVSSFYRVLSALGSAVLLLLLAPGSPAQSRPDAALNVVTEVPFQIQGSRATLEVRVNGEGPFTFGFDTGASGAAWVTQALKEKLDLQIVDRIVVSDDSNVKGRSTDAVRVDSITLGSASFNRLTAPVLGDGPRKEGEPYGTLGFELFENYVLTLDYPAQRLRIATGQLPVPDGRRVLAYRIDGGSPHVRVQFAGVDVETRIDSGNVGGILMPLSLANKLPLAGPLQKAGRVASALNEFDLFRAELDGDVQIGDVTIAGPTLFFSDLVQTPNLGRNVLRSFAITFDQAHQRVQFQSAAH
jgi:hypothetical protein